MLPDVGCVIVDNGLQTFENQDAEEATGVLVISTKMHAPLTCE